MRSIKALFLMLAIVAMTASICTASPVGVSPFSDDEQLPVGERKAGPGGSTLAIGPGLQAAADYIVDSQCSSGGWCWESGTGCCGTGAPYNTVGPIVMGLLNAYAIIGDPSHLAAAELGANWDMASAYSNGEYRASTMSAYMLHRMTAVTGDSTYSDWAETEFFDELTAGTYGLSDYDTHGWIGAVQAGRAGVWINLLPWEFMYLPYTAGQIGNADSAPGDGISQQQAFLDALLSGLNTLDSTSGTTYGADYLGLAGGVYGLAKNGTTTFPPINAPRSPMVDSINALCDLADVLASEQNANGSWYWDSSIVSPVTSDEDTQITAYAVLALIEADNAGCGPYDSEIAKARDWLRTMQNLDGSFQTYPGGGVNTEVDGEALNALVPDGCTDNKLVLEVPSASACVTPGEQVTVELWQRNLLQPVRGYQAWLQFASTQMAFVSGTYTATPFGLPVITPIAASGDDIDLAAGLFIGQSPTTADALLATLVFDTTGMADGSTVVSFRDRQPPSRFTDETGQPVDPCLVPSPTILIDGTDPVIACPPDVTVECHASTDPSNTGTATATDNLDDNPVVTYSDTPDLSGCGAYTGTITRTWTATDCAGNTETCVQVITVVDTTDPVITCPADVTIECDEFGRPPETPGTATATDNCDGDVTITYSDSSAAGACAQASVITRTWTATDDCGNTDVCVQVITVVDTTPPAITCPSDATVECDTDTSPATLGMATATDNCDPAPAIASSDVVAPGACDEAAVITRTWTATDDCGNIAICVQTITVQDTTPPVISGIPNRTFYSDPGVCGAVVTWPDPTITDNCGIVATSFLDGFEMDPYLVNEDPDWFESNSTVIRVVSGTDGITSKSGAAHGVIDSTTLPAPPDDYSGAFTRLGGYSSEFGLGFTASLDVYIDLSDPAVTADTYGWDLSVAASNQSGSHLRDFIFHTASDASGNVLVGASNNSNGTRRNDLASINHHTITASGWYHFEWDFHDKGDDTLEVDLNLYDGSGTWLWTETRNNPSDLISTAVGGNRYMWFTFLEVDTLAVDNTTKTAAGNVTVTVTPPSGSFFPVGTTQVSVYAEDDCGNWVESFFDITVVGFSEMYVDLSLDGVVNDPTTRCITFELWDCGVGGSPTVVEEEITFVGGAVTGHVMEVPCGDWTCITARDKLHTLRRTLAPPAVVGAHYVASFSNPLIGGNLNDDQWIDILDFGVFNWQYGFPGGDTTCSSVYPHADIDGDGSVDSDDFSFIQINFLETHDPNCCGAPAPLDGAMPVLSISVQDLIARGLGHLAAGDLNNDGWLDQADVIAFMQGARPDQFGIGGVQKHLMQIRR
jgi:hypothetical protein